MYFLGTFGIPLFLTVNGYLMYEYDERFLNDIEVLIIDDGSKDSTADIAVKYQNMAPESFVYVHKENGGHGSTINKGIELAKGKYFRVIDGDDWVDTDNFAKYIKRLKNENADMVLTQYKSVSEESEKLEIHIKKLRDGQVYSWEDGTHNTAYVNYKIGAFERKQCEDYGKLFLCRY